MAKVKKSQKKQPSNVLSKTKLVALFVADVRRYIASKKQRLSHRKTNKSSKTSKTLKQRLQPVYQHPQFGPLVLIFLAVFASFAFNFISAKHMGVRHPSVLASNTTANTPATVWCEACRVSAITIPSVVFSDANVSQVSFDQKQKTWPTPVTGIATPAETVMNNIVVFGHSLWFGKTSEFSRISGLKIGDKIYVSDQFGGSYTFVVTKLELDDRMDGDAVHAKPSQQLTLLTSARFNGQWLLPTEVDPATVDNVQDPTKYAIFVVTAIPQD